MPVGGPVYVVEGEALAASTSLALVRVYRQVHDTNLWYASLGITPDATRREIREAYQRLDGHESARLTYIVKQLLHPEIRRKYDDTPLGSLYMDYEVETWIRRARVQETSRLRAQGRVSEAEELEVEDLGELLDTATLGDEGEPAQPFQTVEWKWGYYLHDTFRSDRTALAQWQELLVSAFGRAGHQIQLAVGFSGGMESPWGVVMVGNQTVVFLHDGEQPTEALASRVVNQHQPVLLDHEHGDKEMSAGFRKGAEAAKDASKGGSFARTQFFGLKDQESTILRFLTDADVWITVDQHQMIPTKAKPSDYPADANWPERMGSVCRRDPAFSYGECYICDFLVGQVKSGKGVLKKPGGRTWALACLREEVKEDGKVVGLRDKTREVTIAEKDGQPERTITEKAIVVVNLGYKNFFSILEGFAGRYGTILDRDYWIKRSGDDKDTTYQVVPMDPIDTERGRFDLREPEFMQRYKSDLDLETTISERADDDFYARFFDPRFSSSKDGKIEATGAVPDAPAAPSGEVDAERLAALSQRVKGYGGGDAPASETPAESAKEPATAASGGGMKDYN